MIDPRNDQDYDTFMYGTEPLPGDRTWVRRSGVVQKLKKLVKKLVALVAVLVNKAH
jgi:hypothetical protein